MATINIADKLTARLAKLVQAVDGEPRVSVGFLPGTQYPDGTSIPMVAAANEFGVPARNQPPRPFFRRMVADKAPTWGKAIAVTMKVMDNDVEKTLKFMGQEIQGQLRQSIRDLTDPPLSPKTIARKGFDKPLIDTNAMLRNVGYKVDLD